MNLARALAALVLLVAPAQGSDQGAVESRPFDLQGHRGARGLAPENTLAAFAKALAIGVTTLETDLAVTTRRRPRRPPRPACSTPTSRAVRTASGSATPGPAIRSLTLAELKRYDIGRLESAQQVRAQQFAAPEAGRRRAHSRTSPSCSTLVRAGATDVRFNIEIKLAPDKPDDWPDPERFAQARRRGDPRGRAGAPRTIQSFDWRTLHGGRSGSRPRSTPSA